MGLYFNTIVFIFNVFDTIGRYGPNYVKISLHQLKIHSFIRLLLFLLFGIIVALQKYGYLTGVISSIISLILMIVLGLSNGYYCSKCFYYAPQLVSDELKGKAASFTSFCLILGIFTGSMFANFLTQILI